MFVPRLIITPKDTLKLLLCVLFQVIVLLMLSHDVKPSRHEQDLIMWIPADNLR